MLSACFEDPDCIGLKNNLITVSFKKLFDRKADTVGVYGVSISGTDSIFSQLRYTDGVTLPLNFSQNQQVIDFNLLTGQYSLTANYKAKAQFESPDCGPRFIFSDLEVTQHNFDSLSLVNSVPGEEPGVSNINVYRCPYTNNVKIGFRQLFADTEVNGQALQQDLFGVRLDYSSLIYWPDTLISAVTLPLNLNTTSTQVVFDTKTAGLLQLGLNYTITPQTLFEVCGEQRFISNLTITGSDFDIARINKDSIADPPVTNVLLLRCPDTNLIKMKLTAAAGGSAVPFDISKVTASYSSEIYYADSTTSSLTLPLDKDQAQTDFTLEFVGANNTITTKHISVGYARTSATYHEACNQTLFSNLTILSSDFTTAPIIRNDSIQFPTVDNIEVVNN